jgi:hypothetical protein
MRRLGEEDDGLGTRVGRRTLRRGDAGTRRGRKTRRQGDREIRRNSISRRVDRLNLVALSDQPLGQVSADKAG